MDEIRSVPYSLAATPPLPITIYTGHKAVMPRGYCSWGALEIPQLVRAEPGRQTHFGAVQFKISAYGVLIIAYLAAKA